MAAGTHSRRTRCSRLAGKQGLMGQPREPEPTSNGSLQRWRKSSSASTVSRWRTKSSGSLRLRKKRSMRPLPPPPHDFAGHCLEPHQQAGGNGLQKAGAARMMHRTTTSGPRLVHALHRGLRRRFLPSSETPTSPDASPAGGRSQLGEFSARVALYLSRPRHARPPAEHCPGVAPQASHPRRGRKPDGHRRACVAAHVGSATLTAREAVGRRNAGEEMGRLLDMPELPELFGPAERNGHSQTGRDG